MPTRSDSVPQEDDKSIRVIEMIFIINGAAAIKSLKEEVEEKYTSIPWTLMYVMWNCIARFYFQKISNTQDWQTGLPISNKL